MSELLKGVNIINIMKPELRERVQQLEAKEIAPCLAIVRIGERQDDIAYESSVLKRFESLGIKVSVFKFDEDISSCEFVSCFEKINDNKKIHGILMFRPFPKHIEEEAIKEVFAPEKDIDGMLNENIAKVFNGDETGFAPCTAAAVVEILKGNNINLVGAKVCIVGRSMVVGKPLSMLLLKENSTVTICHTKTKDLVRECQQSDIIVAAAGVAKMIKAEHVNENTVVIDVGINVDEDGKMCGDVDFAEVEPKCGKISPVPGGVGGITTMILARNVLTAAERLV